MKSIYMLAEGRGRIRGDRQGGTRKEVGWNSIVISTGEAALSSSSEFSGISMRCFELYGPVLSHLSGDQVVEVETIARNNYGFLGRKLVKMMEIQPELVEVVKSSYGYWRRRFAEAFPGNFGHRMSGYAAIIAIGGLVLHDLLLEDRTEPQEIFNVIEAALREEAAEKGRSYAERALELLSSWVTEHRGLFSSAAEAGMLAGKFTDEGVAFLPTVLRRASEELRLDFNRVVRDFDEKGWLEKESGRRQKTIRFGSKTDKCYVINKIRQGPKRHNRSLGFPHRSQEEVVN